MRVLTAMSGGVDSSVAAAMLAEEGHEVVGVTMKLWGGPSDSGCCSVADVEDARRVAAQLGIDHHVFNFSDEFEQKVVSPYVADHAAGRTPNPCVECNRHLKFDRLTRRAAVLGFDAVATGHHARVARAGGRWALLRGVDREKDQSYVLHMLRQEELARLRLPVGEITKAEVRNRARALGLRTAEKPDSQDVCFISRRGGRAEFLGSRMELHPGTVIDASGEMIGSVPAVELVTIGQRRGLGQAASGPGSDRRFAISIDVDSSTVTLGGLEELLVSSVAVERVAWVGSPPSPDEELEAQTSAHGLPVPVRWDGARSEVLVPEPIRRVAPGQSVVLYRGDVVVGGGIARP